LVVVIVVVVMVVVVAVVHQIQHQHISPARVLILGVVQWIDLFVSSCAIDRNLPLPCHLLFLHCPLHSPQHQHRCRLYVLKV
jgi:hypothetical protein